MKIVIFPDEGLHKTCQDCVVGDKSLVRLSKEMAKLMYKFNGVGLAAPQVGDKRRIIVVDCDYDVEDRSTRDPFVLVNPEIVELKGNIAEGSEGCLSCPGISVPINRHSCVKVRYFDLDGCEWEIETDGLLARCLQHEIDHLNGKTIFETCEPEARLKALADYEIAKQKGCKPGDV